MRESARIKIARRFVLGFQGFEFPLKFQLKNLSHPYLDNVQGSNPFMDEDNTGSTSGCMLNNNSKTNMYGNELGLECQTRAQDEIVISGISGRFPESDDLHEFWENLVNGVDMITEDDRRWTPGLNGLPTRSGKIKTLDKFDAQFFGVHPKQAECMDPQLRMLLEVTHEAIIDAGVNPVTIRGSRTGVFVGACGSECERVWFKNIETQHGYALTGTQGGMLSNRVSFSFDFQGPSFTVDTACSSSFIALEQAVSSIRLGHCAAAIVAGSNLCLDPNTSLQFHRLSMLSPDGKCKSFDASGNGYVRSEAVVAVFIQKKDVVLRSYASILAARTNSDGHKEKGVTFPSGDRQAQLLQETYKEAGIDPKDVAYVEAHGTGTQAGDPQELNAIAHVFCKNREKENPLLIGSVKSNAGHAEPASGLMSMAKVLLSIQKGILPANLHYKTPNLNIPALCDGRLKVVTENTPWNGGIVGMNSFGFGGANVHIILKSKPKEISNDNNHKTSSIPFLIPFSGRTKNAVEFALKTIARDISSSNLHLQIQRISLLHEIARSETPGHPVRGNLTITPNLKETDVDIQENVIEIPPVWFIFNGMGSQWPQMGQKLLKIPVFQNSIEESAAILKPHGIDLMSVLIDDDETALTESVVKSFVAITSIQVALVDLLRSLGVTPTGGIIGHSVGELAASYADGCFTASQTVLASWARGKAIMELAGKIGAIEGAMAAVGLSWEDAHKRCPPGVYPACHNAEDSVTISGPKKDIEIFVQNLKNEGIFAKEVNSSKMAFHSKYIEPAKTKLKSLMDEIIPAPHPRSARWISSSIPENEWNSPLAQFSSADYHANNLVSPVLFQESLQKIPEGFVVIEIGPHALLQAILKRSLPKCTNIGLVNKNYPDNSVFLLQALGKLYNSGINLNVSALYPPTQFPVAVDTPSISHLVKWDHSLSWDVPRFPENDSLNPSISSTSNSGENVMEISLNEESQKFYRGHKIDGRIIFPATGYLFLIWKAFASLHKKTFEQVPVVLENVSILRATVLPVDGAPVKFRISILSGSGEFEVKESNVVIINGIVRSPNSNPNENEFLTLAPSLNLNLDQSRIPLSKVDAYKELRLRGYEYSGPFQGIQILDTKKGQGEIKWQKNWVSFLDTVLQLAILHKNTRGLYLPTHLDKAIFDPAAFLQSLQQQKEENGAIVIDDDDAEDEDDELLEQPDVPVFFYPDLNVVTCEGIQFQRMKAGMAPRRSTDSNLLRLEKFQFTPYFDDINSTSIHNSLENSLSVCLDVVLENIPKNKLKMLEILGNVENSTESFVISQLAQRHVLNQPTKTCNGKAISLGQCQGPCQGSQVTETLENSGIKVTLSTLENEAELIQKMSNSVNLVITDETRLLKNTNSNFTALALKNQEFLLYHKQESESVSDLKKLEDSNGLCLVAHKFSATRHFYLFRKSLANLHDNVDHENQNLINTVEINLSSEINAQPNSLSHFNYSWVEDLKMAVQKAVDLKNEPNFRIYVISKEIKTESGLNIPSGVLGLVNSLRKEPGGDKIRCFFYRDSKKISTDSDSNFLKPSKNLSTVMRRDLVMNVFEKNAWGSMRFYSFQDDIKMTRNVDHAYLNVLTRGDLSSFRWIESNLKYHEPQSEICSVYYAPLNFRDVMLCTGKLPLDSLPNNLGTKDCVLGLEWSGKTSEGVRVMGVVQVCGLATSIVPDKEFLWQFPETWTLAQASTVPVAYATAYYALFVRGKIQNGESVLIHAGAGGVGMAAIRIALSINCTVYTTVGSEEKRDFLIKTFPQLNQSSFSNSRDSSFLEHILRETRGRGVDLVLNSLAGDKLQASIKCLAFQGRFLEIGKVDLFKNTGLGMSILLKNVSVHGILLDGLKDGHKDKLQTMQIVQEGLDSGVVQPLKSTIFADSLQDVEQAFRFMASGKHVGKILIEIRKENDHQPKLIETLPRTNFDPTKCYIIIGGLGGFGLELCGWLIERGASKLVLVSRSGVRNGYQENCLRKWRKEGVNILTPTTDITTLKGSTSLLQEAMLKLDAPVGGIFNLAMVLADGVLQNQTSESFQMVSRPKINSTICMDQVSQELTPSLEYFVVFSSVASGRGAPGLSNYAWANSAIERICERRQKDGLPGLAIMWGAIGDVGVLQEAMRMGNKAVVGGTMPQRISSCLKTLDIFLNESRYNHQPVLSSIVLAGKTNKSGAENGGLKTSLMEKIGNILGMKPGTMQSMNPLMKLYEIGMDSLMGVEIKQLLEMTTGTTLQDTDLLELTFGKLQTIFRDTDKCSTDQMAPVLSPIASDEDMEVQEQSDKFSNLSSTDSTHVQNKSFERESRKAFVPSSSMPPSLEVLGAKSEFAEKDNHPHPILYLFVAFGLVIIFHLVVIFFIPLRVASKIYLKIFHNTQKSRIKLSERPMDDLVFLNPQSSNIVTTVTCEGAPNRLKLIKTLEERLVHWKTNIRLDKPTKESDPIYEPYESLQWRLEQGLLFNYWIKEPGFSIKDHIVFETFQVTAYDTLEKRVVKAVEFYSSYDWSNDEDKQRPQWQVKIIAPKLVPNSNSKEFSIIFSVQHSYGDALSVVHLLQYAFCDHKQVALKSSLSPEFSTSQKIQEEKQGHFDLAVRQLQSKSLDIFRHVMSRILYFLKRFHMLVFAACESNVRFHLNKIPHLDRHYHWTELSLGKLKSVRDEQSGKMYPASAVILTCASLAYEKLYKKAGKLDHLPKEIIFGMSGVISPYPTLCMINNAVANNVTIPVHSCEDDDGHNLEETIQMQPYTRIRNRVKAATNEINTRLTVEKLQAVQDVFVILSYFPIPILKCILRHFSPKLTLGFSHVPAVLPRNYTYFGGHKLKSFHGTSLIAPGAQGMFVSVIDSAKNTVSLSLLVDDRATAISPTFLSDFFYFFQQSLENLCSC